MDCIDSIIDEQFDMTRDIIALADETIDILETLIADAQDSIDRIEVDRRKYDYATYCSATKAHRQFGHLACSIYHARSVVDSASSRIGNRHEKIQATNDKIELLASIITKLSGND